MLKKVSFIQNIGRFEQAKSTNDAIFGRCTLVFGENGWGKSTLADILRALATKNSDILVGRKTLREDVPSKAVLCFGAQNTVFENEEWNGPCPRIAVYDSAFVNDNVFSGDIVSIEHMRSQYSLVVGEEGVRYIQRILELDKENRENNGTISVVESRLNAAIGSVGLSTMDLKTFLVLESRQDIDKEIAEKDTQVKQVQRANELKVAAEPMLFPVPLETVKIRDLLGKSIDEIAEDALIKVRAHIDTHQCKNQEYKIAHETWLETGMSFEQADNCPFCGQPLTDRSLVDAYSGFFSQSYKELSASVKDANNTLVEYGKANYRQAVLQFVEQNTGHFHYWREVGNLAPPVINTIDALIPRIQEAATKLEGLFAKKQANLTESVLGAEVDGVLAAWEKARDEFLAVNQKIEAFLLDVKGIKDSIDPATLVDLEKELKIMRATKRRHEPEIVELVASLRECKSKREKIAQEKAAVRDMLDKYEHTITTELGDAINIYLQALGAGFRIDYEKPSYRGGREPIASYKILIRGVPISPFNSTSELDKPSIRNTLSGGDKSTLALAFFLAQINADPDLADTIIVLDDPFSSLDEFRRRFTAIEIKKLCRKALQVIVLSHEKNFLRHIWDKVDHTLISSLALQTGSPGMTTIAPYDIEKETRPRYISEREKLDEFIKGELHDVSHIRTRLRTVCEHFYRSGDPSLFPPTATLEQIIRILEGAPADHPYKGALEELRDINEYSRSDSHAAVSTDSSDDTSIEELKVWCQRVLDLTKGF